MNTNKPDKNKKLVHLTPPFSFKTDAPKTGCTKKRARKKAEGHIEPYRSSGRTFYRYRRGRDRPVYLGPAEKILEKMKGDNDAE